MNKGLSHNKGPFAADQGGPLLWDATVPTSEILFKNFNATPVIENAHKQYQFQYQ